MKKLKTIKYVFCILVAMILSCFFAWNFFVNAESIATTKIVITDWNIKDCTIFDVNFWNIDVSLYNHEYEGSWKIHCIFLTSAGLKLTYQMEQSFSSQSYTIPNTEIFLKAFDLEIVQWNLNTNTSLQGYMPINMPLTIYQKQAGTVWDMYQEVDFKLNALGGIPAWQYSWTVVLTIQPIWD